VEPTPVVEEKNSTPPNPEPDDDAGLSHLVKDLKVTTVTNDKGGDAVLAEESTEKVPKKWLGVW
jgi:hypothetical protein